MRLDYRKERTSNKTTRGDEKAPGRSSKRDDPEGRGDRRDEEPSTRGKRRKKNAKESEGARIDMLRARPTEAARPVAKSSAGSSANDQVGIPTLLSLRSKAAPSPPPPPAQAKQPVSRAPP